MINYANKNYKYKGVIKMILYIIIGFSIVMVATILAFILETIKAIRNPRPRMHNAGPRFSAVTKELTQTMYGIEVK